MPPRKRARASTVSTPNNDVQVKTPVDTASQHTGDTHMAEADAFVLDPWTNEQETNLLRGLMKWKPAGLHKHFHMTRLSLQFADPNSTYNTQNYLRNPSKPSRELSIAPHTRIPGIWTKLSTLYSLQALDEREDARTFPEFDVVDAFDRTHSTRAEDESDEDGDENAATADKPRPTTFKRFLMRPDRGWTDFRLEDAGDDFSDRMWDKRFDEAPPAAASQTSGRRGARAKARSESPPVLGWDAQRTAPNAFHTSATLRAKYAEGSAAPASAKGAQKGKGPGRAKKGGRGAARSESPEEEPDDDGDEDMASEAEDEDEEAETSSATKAKRGRPSAASRRKSTRKR